MVKNTAILLFALFLPFCGGGRSEADGEDGNDLDGVTEDMIIELPDDGFMDTPDIGWDYDVADIPDFMAEDIWLDPDIPDIPDIPEAEETPEAADVPEVTDPVEDSDLVPTDMEDPDEPEVEVPDMEDAAHEDTATEEVVVTPGWYLLFDGIDDRATVNDNDALTLGSAATIEAWVKVDDATGQRRIIGRWSPVPSTCEYYLDLWSGQVRFAGNGTGGQFTVSFPASALSDDGWDHLAGVLDPASGTAAIYLNGIPMNSTATTVALDINSSSPLRLGHGYSGWFFKGGIDEVRIWNVARTPAQIAASMFCLLAGSEAGLAAYFRFNEGSGAAFGDSSSSGLSGSLSADPMTPLWQTPDTIGVIPCGP
ncbi:MAG: LamG domain-containing protein [Pseudomonadota bacterium]